MNATLNQATYETVLLGRPVKAQDKSAITPWLSVMRTYTFQ